MKHALTLAAIATLSATAATAAPHGGSAFIHEYDTNKDGTVTRPEFDAERLVRFTATDANKDGTVSEEEYVSEYSARLEKQLAASTDSAETKAEERQRQIRQTHVRFEVLDTNKDKKMQQSEYDASGARAYAQQDDDKNGTVTQADADATAAKQLAARESREQK